MPIIWFSFRTLLPALAQAQRYLLGLPGSLLECCKCKNHQVGMAVIRSLLDYLRACKDGYFIKYQYETKEKFQKHIDQSIKLVQKPFFQHLILILLYLPVRVPTQSIGATIGAYFTWKKRVLNICPSCSSLTLLPTCAG